MTMNFYDPNGHLLDYRRIDELAGLERISLRTGCFCNPGAGETAEGLTEEDMRAGMAEGADITLPRFLQIMHGHADPIPGAGSMDPACDASERRRGSRRRCIAILDFADAGAVRRPGVRIVGPARVGPCRPAALHRTGTEHSMTTLSALRRRAGAGRHARSGLARLGGRGGAAARRRWPSARRCGHCS